MNEVKQPKTYDEQIEILTGRGIVIDNNEDAIEMLQNLNYYRMTAYFLPFKMPNGNYQEGTLLSRVYRIYEFDRKLRALILSALEEVEVGLRSRIAYYHAHKYGSLGYMDGQNYNMRHDHQKFVDQFQREVENNKNAAFVRHHIERYDGQFPVWVAVELFSFGMLSRFYSDLQRLDQKAICRNGFYITTGMMRSWLRCCTDLRNICAHFGRLYYRVFPATPSSINADEYQSTHLWGALLALKGLYLDKDKWNASFVSGLSTLIEEYSDSIKLEHIAFPQEWEMRIRK